MNTEAAGYAADGELEIKTAICNDIRECGAQVVIHRGSAEEQWRTHPAPMLYGFKSYASFPIVLEDGSFLGPLCAVNPAPHAA